MKIKMSSAEKVVENDCKCDPYLLSLVQSSTSKDTNKQGKSTGLVLASITGGLALSISAMCLPFVIPAFRRVRNTF